MSEEKIVPIFPGIVVEGKGGESNQYVIAALEECLEQAKAGEIIGVVIAKKTKDNKGEYTFGGRLGMTVVGALTSAAMRVAKMDGL